MGTVMRPWMRWTGIGCGGLMAVSVLLAVISSVAGPKTAATPTPAPVAQEATAAPAAAPTSPAKPAAPAATAVPPPASQPTPQPSPPPTEPPAPTAAERVRVIGTAPDGLNVRAEPSSTAARVKTVPDGAELEIAGPDAQADGRAWRKVRDPSDGAEGYAAAQFLAAPGAAPPPAAVVATKPAGQPVQAAAPKATAAPPPPTAAPKPAAPAPQPAVPAGRNCSDFPNQAAAQAALRANPSDPNKLDTNKDGVACESLGGQQDRRPVPR